MRMNLAEVALSLGCALDSIVWRNGGPWRNPEPATAGECCLAPTPPLGTACAPAGPSFEARYAELAARAPWATVVPVGAGMDSRTIRPGDIFFCLPGERVDGHDFALAAARAGACAIVANRNPFWDADVSGGKELPPVFLVQDVQKALWRAAVCHRDTSMARVIGITGTAGKTSVKEVLAQILALRGLTQRNPMNLNNQIGLPLSMLNASAEALFWVMEAGISEERDMDELGQILRPDAGLILNVGEGHLSGLGGRGVAANKALLLDYIQPGGLALVSVDYPDLREEVKGRDKALADRGVETFGFSARSREAFAWAEYLGPSPDNAGQYRVSVDGREFFVHAPFQGAFGSENVAAVAAMATKMGLKADEIARGFAAARLPDQRFNCRRYGDVMLVDDSYNANPLSATRMVDACRTMADESGLPLVLVMGEMLELGERAEQAHEELGRTMAQASPALVFWKGGQAEAVQRGLRGAGYDREFYPVSGGQDFSLLLEELEPQSGLFLFKGSRRNNLERLVDILRERVTPTGEPHAV